MRCLFTIEFLLLPFQIQDNEVSSVLSRFRFSTDDVNGTRRVRDFERHGQNEALYQQSIQTLSYLLERCCQQESIPEISIEAGNKRTRAAIVLDFQAASCVETITLTSYFLVANICRNYIVVYSILNQYSCVAQYTIYSDCFLLPLYFLLTERFIQLFFVSKTVLAIILLSEFLVKYNV